MSEALLCRHFGLCGGCAHQDMPDDAYRAVKRSIVVETLASHGLYDIDVAEMVVIAPRSRRRAAFKAARNAGTAWLGFHAAASHDIVDMQECRVLAPALFALLAPLRAMMAELLADGETADVSVTLTEGGPDVAMRGKFKSRSAAALAQWAARLGLARLSLDGEPLVTLARPSVTFGKAAVTLPPDAFLQPTVEGEAFLQQKVAAALKGAKSSCDLFSGCGTFALVLAQQARVHAVDGERAQLEALADGGRTTQGLKPVTTEVRDLLKRPLAAAELDRFDAIVLDPPRAGAIAQVKEIARSKVRRVAYVSCSPASFARDARVLVAGGFRMGTVTPVDQFLWSSHIELVAAFQRS
jgi:23S rRNA (uracil1939-C5)-methyltransferase